MTMTVVETINSLLDYAQLVGDPRRVRDRKSLADEFHTVNVWKGVELKVRISDALFVGTTFRVKNNTERCERVLEIEAALREVVS